MQHGWLLLQKLLAARTVVVEGAPAGCYMFLELAMLHFDLLVVMSNLLQQNMQHWYVALLLEHAQRGVPMGKTANWLPRLTTTVAESVFTTMVGGQNCALSIKNKGCLHV